MFMDMDFSCPKCGKDNWSYNRESKDPRVLVESVCQSCGNIFGKSYKLDKEEIFGELDNIAKKIESPPIISLSDQLQGVEPISKPATHIHYERHPFGDMIYRIKKFLRKIFNK